MVGETLIPKLNNPSNPGEKIMTLKKYYISLVYIPPSEHSPYQIQPGVVV
jgi:hypothetical protein